jgi:tetratricopeptide (TPR) repeat protein
MPFGPWRRLVQAPPVQTGRENGGKHALILVAAGLLLGGCSGAPPAARLPEAPEAPLSFHEGSFEAAVLAARTERKLLFVDAWAPWCHTCLSMRETVLDEPALGRYGASYVAVAIDTDRLESSSFVAQYPMRVWPTFFVIDPETRVVLASFGGSMSLRELDAFLDRGVTLRDTDDPGHRAIVAAHEAERTGDLDTAAARFEEATRSLPPARRAEAALGLSATLFSLGRFDECMTTGAPLLLGARFAPTNVDQLLALGRCGEKAADEARALADALLDERLPAWLAAPPEGASVDDRSDAMGAWAARLEKLGRTDEARRVQSDRIALLERAAAASDTPEAAQVFDYERMLAYLAVGRGEDAVRLFRERARELPTSYEAHARLASTLLKMDRPADALPAAERAVELSYGPRRLRYLALRTDALERLGRREEALASAQQELEAEDALPRRSATPSGAPRSSSAWRDSRLPLLRHVAERLFELLLRAGRIPSAREVHRLPRAC